PVTFGEPRRLAIFAYFALKVNSLASIDEILQKFQDDHSALELAIQQYRSDCSSVSARRFVQTGLPSRDAIRSLISYGRGAHGLGLITMVRHGGVTSFKPNWLTVVTQSLRKDFNYYGLSFELPSSFKLLMAQQLIANDWEMTGAAISAIGKMEERDLILEKLAVQISAD